MTRLLLVVPMVMVLLGLISGRSTGTTLLADSCSSRSTRVTSCGLLALLGSVHTAPGCRRASASGTMM